ncbi:unnamed protein product [Diplocarpon coronariae]
MLGSRVTRPREYNFAKTKTSMKCKSSWRNAEEKEPHAQETEEISATIQAPWRIHVLSSEEFSENLPCYAQSRLGHNSHDLD